MKILKKLWNSFKSYLNYVFRNINPYEEPPIKQYENVVFSPEMLEALLKLEK